MKFRTRFAPSPTGLLHAGNAFSALLCQQWADKHHAGLLLRIEDIDHTRCRDEYTGQLIEDLGWLGLKWHGDILKQSEHQSRYRKALERLEELGVIYPCFCTRRHIQQEIERMGIAPHAEDIGDPYPGICRQIDLHQRHERRLHERFAWRLDCAKAVGLAGESLTWRDEHGYHHPVNLSALGDMVIGRKDIGISYHLAVVVDDAWQGITHVIRGEDLLTSTPVHRLLQALLELPSPTYIHHPLLVDRDGERLAKRNSATTLKSLRDAGISADSLRRFLLADKQVRWPFSADDMNQIREQLGSSDQRNQNGRR
ncbi:MAG: tRNA glutamyl-Q(34) synthetase GluQRS [Mariprofundaceae bacterium]|nr:tRNA glutamyl-Q(34) synthetase GluQRS [Mariprofundaceae bacterium]